MSNLNTNKPVDWAKISDTEVRLTFSDGKHLIVPYEDFNRAFGAILTSSFEEIFRDYVQGKTTILGVRAKPLEIGKPAYIYDAVNDNVIKTTTVEHFIVVNPTRVHIITRNNAYDVVTHGNHIQVPVKAMKLIENDLNA